LYPTCLRVIVYGLNEDPNFHGRFNSLICCFCRRSTRPDILSAIGMRFNEPDKPQRSTKKHSNAWSVGAINQHNFLVTPTVSWNQLGMFLATNNFHALLAWMWLHNFWILYEISRLWLISLTHLIKWIELLSWYNLNPISYKSW
jgi:hypothetical protein